MTITVTQSDHNTIQYYERQKNGVLRSIANAEQSITRLYAQIATYKAKIGSEQRKPRPQEAQISSWLNSIRSLQNSIHNYEIQIATYKKQLSTLDSQINAILAKYGYYR